MLTSKLLAGNKLEDPTRANIDYDGFLSMPICGERRMLGVYSLNKKLLSTGFIVLRLSSSILLEND